MQARVIHVYYRDGGHRHRCPGIDGGEGSCPFGRLDGATGLSGEAPWHAARRRCKRIVAPFAHDNTSAARDCKGVHVPRQGSLQMNAAIVDLPRSVRSVSQPVRRFLH